MSASAAPSETVSGTVLQVLSPGGGGQPWRAVVMEPFSDRPVIARLAVPPSGLRAGDDLHFRGVRIPSGDLAFPDEVRAEADDAEARIAAMLSSRGPVVMEASASQAPSAGAAGLADLLGLTALAGAAREGLVSASASGGVLGVVRSRSSADPVVAWAMERFRGGPEAPAAMVVDPLALLPRSPRGAALAALGRAVAAAGTLFPKRARSETVMAPVVALPGLLRRPAPQPADRIWASMPVLIQGRRSHDMAGSIAAWNPVAYRMLDAAPAGPGLVPHMVLPFNPVETGAALFNAISGFSSEGPFMARATPGARARHMLAAGHEFGHVRQWARGYGYSTLAEKNLSERFADAVGTICHVLETGDAGGARAFGDMRAVSALAGVETHCTGAACAEAVEVALALRAMRGSDVPLEEILEAADRIALSDPIHDPEAVSRVAARLRENDPDWAWRDHGGIADAVWMALDAEGHGEEDDPVRRLFLLAVEALPRAAFTPGDLRTPEGRAAALAAERADLAETADELRSRGMGALVPDMLDAAGARFRAAAAAGAERRALRGFAVLAGRIPALARAVAGTDDLTGWRRRLAEAAVMPLLRAVGALAGTPDDFVADLADRRGSPVAREALAHVLRAGVEAPPASGLLTLLDGGPGEGTTDAFDMDVRDRMRLLGELSFRAEEIRRSAGRPGTARHLAAAQAAAPVTARMNEIAWSLRVDADAWAALSRTYPAAALEELSRVAAPGAAYLPPRSPEADRQGAAALRSAAQHAATARELHLHARWNEGRPDGRRLDWSGRDLRWMDLRRLDLRGADLGGADLRGADLAGTDLSHAILAGVQATGVRGLGLAALKGADTTDAVGLPHPRKPPSRGPVAHYAEIDGARRLHREDGFAVIREDGRGRAYLNGSPAAVVEFTDAEGRRMTTRLIDARDAEDRGFLDAFGADARACAPREEHFAAIRRANDLGDRSDAVPMDDGAEARLLLDA